MTDKKSRRVVIIDNINSENIDQAIFILKSDPSSHSTEISSGVAKEAQNIIDNYIRQVERLKDGYSGFAIPQTRRKRFSNLVLFALAGLATVALGLILTLFYMS